MTISNWNSTAGCDPTRVVTPKDLDHLVTIVNDGDVERSPSPVRAVGSLHSLNPCFTTTGTLVQMKSDAFRYIRDPGNDSVTVGAGVTMIDLKEALKAHGLQIPVTPEIGDATAGSVACCGTKDASLDNGWGQISSTVTGARIVDATGTERAVTADELRAFRSSYGLFGIVHEVTFETCPLQRVEYASESIPISELTVDRALGRADGFLGFMLPYLGKFVAERRTLVPGRPLSHTKDRGIRTEIWKRGGFPFTTLSEYLGGLGSSFGLPSHLDPAAIFDRGFETTFTHLGPFVTDRVDTMIHFDRKGDHFFDFAFWAFPLHTWREAIPAYVQFCQDFLGTFGFRPALPTEVYRIKHDRNALLSFSPAEDVFTLDMVHMLHHGPGSRDQRDLWDRMNDDFNTQIALRFGARPLLNQTKRLTPEIVRDTLGDDWTTFAQFRAQKDPGSRFLSDYFAQLGA